MQEKKVFITTDGKEFESQGQATKHENKYRFVTSFFNSYEVEGFPDGVIDSFVHKVSQDDFIGSKMIKNIGSQWEQWNEEDMDYFIKMCYRFRL